LILAHKLRYVIPGKCKYVFATIVPHLAQQQNECLLLWLPLLDTFEASSDSPSGAPLLLSPFDGVFGDGTPLLPEVKKNTIR
jgi:hypothetical protein